ncbi:hypothetical protein ACHQM5_015289 [Ranunculus cassubicifolius]
MVAGNFSDEFTTSIPPKRFWGAAIVDAHNIVPKIAPQYIASVEVQGDGGAGTTKIMKFGSAVKEFAEVKNVVDVLDAENFVYKYHVVGGKKFETLAIGIKLEASADGGSVCKVSGEYSTVGDYVPTEDEIKVAREGPVTLLKAVESYLLAKPEAYASPN